MGAVRMRVQTADKNTTVIHELMSEQTKLRACKKQIHHNGCFNFNHCLSTLSIITLPPVKIGSGLNQERNLHRIKHCLQEKTDLNIYMCGFKCERQQGMNWRRHCYGFWPEI